MWSRWYELKRKCNFFKLKRISILVFRTTFRPLLILVLSTVCESFSSFHSANFKFQSLILWKDFRYRLQRFEKTNEMLSNCNTLSSTRLERASKDFRNHINYLTELKKDLEVVFKRIRIIKSKLSKQNPEAFLGEFRMPNKMEFFWK